VTAPAQAGTTAHVLAAIDRRWLAVAIALFAAHVALKAPGAGARSLWLDEAWTIALAHRPADEVVAVSRHDQNPPLYNLLMRPWIAVFGDSEAAARWPSVMASAATASALFLLARRFFGIEAALYASLLFAASEPQLYYAREARSYAVVGLLCTISFHLFLANLERPLWHTALALGLVNAALAYTHFSAILALVAQLVAAAALLGARRRAVGLYAAGQAIALALFSPWLEALRSNLPQAGRFWLAPPSPEALREVALELAGGGAAAAGGCAVIALAAAAGRWRPRASSGDLGSGDAAPQAVPDAVPLAVALSWAVVPVTLAFVLSQRVPAFGLRYLLFASLGWTLLVAAATSRLAVPGGARAAAACGLALLAAIGLDRSRSRSADWRMAALLADPGPGTAIVVAPAWQCLPFSYYLDREAFPDPERRAQRLASAGVQCVGDAADVDASRLGGVHRIAVLYGKGVPASFAPSLFDRLERAGYARATARPFPGGLMVELRRSGTTAPADPP
jgi:mannosyltransferase